MAKILEVSHVTPITADSAQSEFCLPLTFSDTFCFKLAPVERLFFYSHAQPRETLLSSVVPKLKRSLSLTLSHFLPLAGTLTWPRDSPKPVVLYRPPNGSVSLTVAESAADLDFLSGDGPREEASFRGLVPRLAASETGASVIAIQVTIFPDKGFCLGVTCHHAVLDGKSTAMFLKSWAHLCRDEENPWSSLPPELTPFFDRSVVRDPKGLDLLCLKQWFEAFGSKVSDPREDSKLFELLPVAEVPSDVVRTTFNLSRADIAKLRRDVQSLAVDGEDLRLSSFVLSFAYIVFCIVEATEESGERVLIGFVADLRSRLKPPVPENYFGNFVGLEFYPGEVRQMVREGKADGGIGRAFAAVAEVVSRTVRKLERQDVMEGAEGWVQDLTSVGPARGIGVAGSPRFEVYGVDFGWGRPQKVEVVSICQTKAVSMAESRDGSGGVEIGVVLTKKEMEILRSTFIQGLKSH